MPYLAKVKEILNEYFPNADYAVSGSITENKTSFHLIINNYVIHNKEERNYVQMITKHLRLTEDEGFDWTVYTKNRNMKAINQSKFDGRLQKIIENADYKKHLITCFIDDYSLPFDMELLPPTLKESIFIEKSKAIFDLATLPKLNLTCPDTVNFNTITAQEILQLLPNNDNLDFEYRHRVCRFCHTNGLELNMF